MCVCLSSTLAESVGWRFQAGRWPERVVSLCDKKLWMIKVRAPRGKRVRSSACKHEESCSREGRNINEDLKESRNFVAAMRWNLKRVSLAMAFVFTYVFLGVAGTKRVARSCDFHIGIR